MDPRRLKIVELASSEIGPGDTSRYWASCGVSPAPKPNTPTGHWCGAFALWALHEASVAQNVMWVIGLGFCEVQGLPKTQDPLPGDIAYTHEPFQHHAIVESWDGTTLVTIDGNQPDVRRKSRPMPKRITFYSISKFLNETPPKPSKPPPAPSQPPPPDEPGLLRGIDVSHHQVPGGVSWVRLAETHKFLIARATYGTRPDKEFHEFVKRALDVGLKVGAYHFFRPGVPVHEQLDAFANMVEHAGMGPGWIVPSLDIEQNEQYDGMITEERYAPAEQMLRSWKKRWGQAMVYTNPSMWPAIGNPEWLDGCYLWIAHYQVKQPRTPFEMPWDIWQNVVGQLPGVYSHGVIDQNVALALPVLSETEKPELIVPELDWVKDRDDWIKENES